MSQTPWGPQLAVRLRLADDHFVEGAVSAISSESLTARFPPDSELLLPLGTRLPIVLLGSGPQTVHEARVMQRGHQEGWVEYGFQAAGLGSFTSSGGRNRRAAYRIELSSREVLIVSILPYEDNEPFAPIHAHIVDLSRLGLGLTLPDEAEDTLFTRDHVRLEFVLPGDEEPFQMVGLVRQRRFQGLTLRYGIEFDPDRTPGHRALEERVNRFVMRRQIDVIRRANRWQRSS